MRRLARAGVAVASVGRTYARLELEARGLDAVCRVSPHAYTTLAEADRFLDAVARPGRTVRRVG